MGESQQILSLEHRRNDDLKRERRIKRLRFLLIITAGAAVAFFCIISYYQYSNGIYRGYTVLKEYEKADSSLVEYLSYQNKILKYSKDGASVFDSDGKAIWNGSYDMKNPKVSICGDYIAIADIGGKDLYVFNGEDSGTEIKVLNNIVEFDVGAQGIVAIAMENGDSNLIAIYDPYQQGDTLRVEIPTTVNNDGFPIDLALSNDGQKLVTGFLHADSILENKVTFYNFDEVGQNDINRQTGMVNLEETLLSNVLFLNNNHVCIYMENGFLLYSMRQKPEEIANITFEETIKSVMASNQYVGVVLEEYSGADKYHLLIYNLKGKKILEQEFSFDYDTVQLTGNDVIFSSELYCHIIRLNGKKKFEMTFDQPVSAVLPCDGNRKYYFIRDYSVQEIQLKRE